MVLPAKCKKVTILGKQHLKIPDYMYVLQLIDPNEIIDGNEQRLSLNLDTAQQE